MNFLDTNTCIYYLNGKYPSILEHFHNNSPGQIMIPSIVKAELLYGVEKSQRKIENRKTVQQFLDAFQIANFDSEAAVQYSTIRTQLENIGTSIGPNDLIIASIVKSQNGILITNNTKEFSRVEGLHLEDWVNVQS
ncbi:MAG: type II toxin-antitoxin system VapC family toxin [Candidatus Marinimicrobia bacterium]|nr:type II toxin-antitoxin system VapC family toxin [Candidatus Neomarinimicrobiota bacterium]